LCGYVALRLEVGREFDLHTGNSLSLEHGQKEEENGRRKWGIPHGSRELSHKTYLQYRPFSSNHSSKFPQNFSTKYSSGVLVLST
jgi:hypothetical protein